MKRADMMGSVTGLVIVALLVPGWLGCNRERATSGAPAGAQPAAARSSTESAATAPAALDVSHSDRPTVTARYAYHPNEGIDSLAKTIPAGSVDALEMKDPMTGLMLVVVEVTVTPKPSAPPSLITTFRLPSGTEVQKPWQGAIGNLSGFYRAVLTVPVDAKYVDTAMRR
jgi:hypothetical protein